MIPEINQAFYQYVTSLEIPHYPTGLVQKRAEQAAEKLKRVGWVVQGHEIIGSYSRGTIIRPLEANNVDVLVELDEGNYPQWQNPEATIHLMRVLGEQLAHVYRENVEKT